MSTPATEGARPLLSTEEIIEFLGRALLSQSQSGIVLADREGRIITASPAFHRIFGLQAPAEMPPTILSELIHPDDRERFAAESTRETMLGGRPLYRAVGRDGREFDVEVTTAPSEFRGQWYYLKAFIDVTDRLEMERALRRSKAELEETQEKFRAFINESAYGYAEFDLTGNFSFANTQAEDICGYRLRDHPNLNFRDVIAPADLDRAIRDLALVLAEPNAGPREYRLIAKDGRVRVVEVNTLPLRKKGAVAGFQSTILDVSDRRRVEDELRHREAILQAVANVSEMLLHCRTWDARVGEALAMIGDSAKVDRVFVFQNQQDGKGGTIMKVPAEWTSPKIPPQQDRFNDHPIPYHEHPLKRLLAVLERGEAVYGHLADFEPGEQAILRITGAKSVIVVPVFIGTTWWGGIGFNECDQEHDWSPAEIDILKALAGILGAVIQRQRIEDAVRESESKYRLVVENASDVIWTFDLDLKLTFVSPSVKRVLGYSAEELLNTGPLTRVAPQSRAKVEQALAKAMAGLAEDKVSGQEAFTGELLELEMVHKDGRPVQIEIYWSYLRDGSCNVIGFQGVSRDVTDRKHSELELKRREALSQAVALAAEKLLQAKDWRDHIPEIIARVGQVFEVSRVLVFEHRPGPQGQILSSPVHVWEDLEVTKHFAKEQYQNLDFAAMGWSNMIAALAQGEIYSSDLAGLPESQQEFFADLGLKSMLAVPVFVGDAHWGFLGFEAGRPRSWTQAEIDIIKTLANTIAAAISRQQAEKSIRESELRYRLVIENLTDIIFTADLAARPIYVSPSVTNVLGYSQEEAMNISFQDLFAPESYQQWNERFRRNLTTLSTGADGSSWDDHVAGLEFQFRHRDGHSLWVEINWTFQRDLAGKVIGFQGVIRDINRRKEAEEALRASERQYRLITENMSDVVWVMSPERRLTYVSSSVHALTGYTVEEFIKLRPRQYHPAATLEKIRESYNNALQMMENSARAGEPVREPYRTELQVIHKDGHLIWVEMTWTIILDSDGAIASIQGVTTDVTERKMAEEAVRDSEQRFRLAANLASDLIYEWKPMESDLKWIGDVDRVFGYEPHEFPRNIFEQNKLVHRDDRPRLLAAIKRFIKQGGFFDEVYRIRKKDGTYAVVSSRATSIRNDKNEILRWIGVNQDITEQRQAEETVRNSEERFRVAAGLASDLIYEWAPGELENHWFGDVDKMFGYGPGEFPRNILVQNRLIHPEDRARVFAAMERLIKAGEPFHEEYRVRRKDGEYVAISSRAAIVHDARDEIVRWIGVNQDITERKKAEDALKLSEERLRAQYNAIPVPTYTWQRQNGDFILIDYNAAAVKITKGKIKEYLGINASRMYAAQPEIVSDLERCFRDRSTFEREMHYKFQSTGLEKFLAVKYAFVAPDQVIAHTEDITEKRQALEAAAEAERRLQQTLSAELTRRRSKEYAAADNDQEQANLDGYPSSAMRKVLTEARIAAQNDITVLLLGNSGAGKTFLAGWIHQNSRRAQAPFFDINCAALTPSLIESELFGHEAGAFTGSKGRKRGLIELAHTGTLFLDEIGDMPLDLQAKLLNFLDSKKLMRVGGEAKVQVDARIVVATNRDLASQVRQGRFREDLYYRLNVLAITVPPLLERKEDLPILAADILKRLAREMGLPNPPLLSPEAITTIENYDWPGNVRELRNILERAILRTDNKSIIRDIPVISDGLGQTKSKTITGIQDPSLPQNGEPFNFDLAVDDFMIALIKSALAKSKTNIEAAEILGISRHALNRYLKKFNLNARNSRN